MPCNSPSSLNLIVVDEVEVAVDDFHDQTATIANPLEQQSVQAGLQEPERQKIGLT